MSTDKQIHLLDELQSSLEKQIELARVGNISEVEVLSKQSGSLVGKIAQAGILLKSDEFGNQREQLQKLYQNLCLAVTAQRNEVAKEIRRVGKGRRTIETYRNNL